MTTTAAVRPPRAPAGSGAGQDPAHPRSAAASPAAPPRSPSSPVAPPWGRRTSASTRPTGPLQYRGAEVAGGSHPRPARKSIGFFHLPGRAIRFLGSTHRRRRLTMAASSGRRRGRRRGRDGGRGALPPGESLFPSEPPQDDDILEFEKAELDFIYQLISPRIVAVSVGTDVITGFILDKTPTHCRVAVNRVLLNNRQPVSVRYTNQIVANIDHLNQINNTISVLYAEKTVGEPEVDDLTHEDPTDTETGCQKIVTFFPYMKGTAMFKGHTILNDPRETKFTFSCPYASAHVILDDADAKSQAEKWKTMLMTLGAPVFSLEGVLLGVLTRCGESYDVKYGMKSNNFFDLILEYNLGGEDAKKCKKRKHMKENTKDVRNRKDKHKQGSSFSDKLSGNMDWDHKEAAKSSDSEEDSSDESDDEDDKMVKIPKKEVPTATKS